MLGAMSGSAGEDNNMSRNSRNVKGPCELLTSLDWKTESARNVETLPPMSSASD